MKFARPVLHFSVSIPIIIFLDLKSNVVIMNVALIPITYSDDDPVFVKEEAPEKLN